MAKSQLSISHINCFRTFYTAVQHHQIKSTLRAIPINKNTSITHCPELHCMHSLLIKHSQIYYILNSPHCCLLFLIKTCLMFFGQPLFSLLRRILQLLSINHKKKRTKTIDKHFCQQSRVLYSLKQEFYTLTNTSKCS